MDTYANMIISINACAKKARDIYFTLKESDKLKDAGITIPEKPPSHYCFRVNNPKTSLIPIISVSVPPDACGNRGKEYNEGEPSTFEFALVDGNNGLMYDSSIGYSDICRFYTMDEIITELVRLSNISKYDDSERKE